MARSFIKSTILIFTILTLTACAKERSIYKDLEPDQDGVVATPVLDDGTKLKRPVVNNLVNQLTAEESDLVDTWHEGEVNKLSFFVVEVESGQILKSYYADDPQRLASVSKIATALGALERVRNVEVPKVQNMLKISNNGEASRYVRLAAKAINGTVLPTKHYPQKHSCPDEFLRDEPAAQVVFDWLKSELPDVDWEGASYNDGAGCNYNNFMTPVQVARMLEYADAFGAAYDGKNFEDLLSINGIDGTWKNKNLEHKGYIFAKTGTLRPNANLSGYFYARRKGVFVKHYFSVFIEKKGAGQYSTRARKLIEGLMKYWIDYYSQNEGQSIGEF